MDQDRTARDAAGAGSPRARRSALVLGATGLVGGECLDRLLAEPAYTRVRVLTRRPLPLGHPKLEQQEIDFERLADHAAAFAVDDVFCCLGSTIRKAGSEQAFRRVDLVYPHEAARLTAEQGAGQFLLVSALGADPTSRVFYNRVKGEAEMAVQGLALRRVVIARPSLLLGSRDESRAGERLAQLVARPLGPLMMGTLARYRPIAAHAVAAALIRLALEDRPGVRVVESDQLARIAAGGV